MGRTTVVRRTLTRLLVVGTLVVATVGAFPTSAWAADRTHAAEETMFASKINVERARAGMGRLVVNLQLTRVARGWSDEMAAADEMSHNPALGGQVSGDWTRLGENVGYSTASGMTGSMFVQRLHDAFMASPGHKANVLGDFNQVGVGVRMSGNTMWVTVNFMKDQAIVSNGAVAEAARVSGNIFSRDGAGGRQASYAVITSSRGSAAALSAVALAGDDAPLLYTHPANNLDSSPVLHPITRAEIDRALGGQGTVYVVGDRDAVSDRAVSELANDGYNVERLAGSTTAATTVRVAREVQRRQGDRGRVVIGSGSDWGSSVAAAMWAAKSGTPFLVSGKKSLPSEIRGFLSTEQPDKRYVVGPVSSISNNVKDAARATRIGGSTRAEVSVNVARRLWDRTRGADGDRWASGPAFNSKGWAYTLAYGPWSATHSGPALLLNDSVPDSVVSYLKDLNYGSRVQGHVRAASVVPNPVVDRVESLVSAP